MKTNNVYYTLRHSRGLSQFVAMAKFDTFDDTVETGLVVSEMLSELLDQRIEIALLADSETSINIHGKNRNTTECGLQIDVFTLRDTHRKKEFKGIPPLSDVQFMALLLP